MNFRNLVRKWPRYGQLTAPHRGIHSVSCNVEKRSSFTPQHMHHFLGKLYSPLGSDEWGSRWGQSDELPVGQIGHRYRRIHKIGMLHTGLFLGGWCIRGLTVQVFEEEGLGSNAIHPFHIDLGVRAVDEVQAWRLNPRLSNLYHASRLLCMAKSVRCNQKALFCRDIG